MFGTIVITCLIFQTAVAIYLLHISMPDDNFEKDLQKLMIIILVHLCAKYFLDIYLQGSALYGNLSTGFSLLYGPFLFIITKSLIEKPLEKSKKIFHLSAFFIFSVLYIFFVAGNIFKIISPGFISTYAFYYEMAVILSQAIYPIVIKMLLRNSAKRKSTDPGKRRLIDNIATILFINILLSIFFHALHYIKPGLSGDKEMKILKYICFAFIPILILRFKLKKKNPAVNIIQPENNKEINEGKETELVHTAELMPIQPVKRYQKSGLDDSMMKEYELALKSYIEKTKIYLDAELTLDGLSVKTNIPKHHLTQILNDKIQKNFYTFINEYRVNEAMRILSNSSSSASDMNILSLAFDCGFNSKSSFNNYFKKITGYTPSAYRKTSSAAPVSA